ncbi:DUF4168 domain-containing protein [Microbacteriaceae bacterium K1510]|nr:DUF4168 domain-containing protein [Microbacteriaceae bacterium K1510]
MRFYLSALALTAVLALSLSAANAQDQQDRSPSASPPAAASPDQSNPSADIPEQKLDATAAAVKNVTAVRQSYEEKLAAAATTDKKRIVDEAQQAMAKAVTDQGLSLEEYTKILQVAQNNPTVQNKIIERLK